MRCTYYTVRYVFAWNAGPGSSLLPNWPIVYVPKALTVVSHYPFYSAFTGEIDRQTDRQTDRRRYFFFPPTLSIDLLSSFISSLHFFLHFFSHQFLSSANLFFCLIFLFLHSRVFRELTFFSQVFLLFLNFTSNIFFTSHYYYQIFYRFIATPFLH